ncbi:hypothetical protein PG994_004540 [Apiospora phragmitis]|uniref:Uncharacterized protein n=1 Tax=Apiospora phragmitis TaxID=2905665 RepID=A0ABR1VTI7_9PEZI
MDTKVEEPFRAEIMAMYHRCQSILESNACLVPSDCHDALELVDAAVDLAEDARLGEETLQRCRELQARCLDLLRKKYRVSEYHERDRYNKYTSTQ